MYVFTNVDFQGCGKWSKYLNVKSQKVKLHRNWPSEYKKSIYSETLDKTEYPQKKLTARHLRLKFEG